MNSGPKRRILIVTQHFYPEIEATAQLMTDLAIDLVDRGLDVTVIAALPYFLTPKHTSPPSKEEYKGITIMRVYTTRFNLTNIFGRIPNWCSFHITSLLKSIFVSRPDVVLTLTIPPYIALVGIILKKMKGTKFILGAQDIYRDVAGELGVIKNKRGIKLLTDLTRWNYRKAGMIIPIGELMKEEIVSQGIDPEKVVVIHNWADGSELYPIIKEENPLIRELGLKDKFIVSYSGNFGIVHDFKPIKKAIEELQGEKNIVFLFIGHGTEKKELERFVAGKGLENVIFLPFQPREKILYSLNACDISLVTFKKGMEGKLLPSKLYGSLAVGKPVIAVCPAQGDLAAIIEENRCGYVDVDNDLAGKILKLYDNPNLREQMGRNGRETFIKKYNRPIATERYFRAIVDL